MAAAPDTPCLSELSGLQTRNVSFISGTRPCNRSSARTPPYSPQATAAFAIAITAMMVVTIVGNILVIIAVLTSRSLKGAQNLFLVSLAAADILVATLIIPFSLANELQGYWAFSSVWCEIYLALDVLFCTSSIVHLCAIALDRYLSISRPVSYGARRTPGRIKAGIIVVWLISAVISFPPLLSLDKSEGGEEVCELNNERWYILYSTIGSFFVPCVIMILVYMRIYQIAKQHTRSSSGQKQKSTGGGRTRATREPVTKLPQQNGDGGGGGGATAGWREEPVHNLSCSDSAALHKPNANTVSADTLQGPHSSSWAAPNLECENQVFSAAPRKDPQRHPGGRRQQLPDNTSSSGSELDVGEEGVLGEDDNHVEERAKPDQQTLRLAQSKGFKVQVFNLATTYKSTMITSSGTKLVSEGNPAIQVTSVSRRKALVHREKRFTFVLAVVMGVFVICWFPFFFTYSLQAVCPETCSIPNPLFKFFFWIGYCNSCLNPVIYTIFNKDFRRAFKRILCKDDNGTFF